tara:strand:+ start:1819 stop:2910 length:1092 start_codon:yes stop_codon:yes gene_type:complete
LKILRVATFPSLEKRTVGLHAAKLCDIESIKTIFLTSKELSGRPKIKGNFSLVEFGKPLEVRSEKQKIYTEFFFILRRIFGLLKFSLYGVWLVLKHKVDIIHIHSPMYILIAIFGFLMNKKIYITFHGSEFSRVGRNFQGIKKAWWYKLSSKIFTKVFSLSDHYIPILSEIHGKNKVISVHNGIDHSIYKNKNLIRKKQIIAVGSFKEQKGFRYLIEAFSNLKKDNNFKEYILNIIGEGRLRTELTNQIDTLNMSNCIFLPGYKNQEELVNLYNESEVFVLSSLSEGFPKVLLEAIACGCKIVSTDIDSVQKVLKNKKLARVGNLDDLTNILSECILNKNQTNIDLSDFTWESLRQIYYREYI